MIKKSMSIFIVLSLVTVLLPCSIFGQQNPFELKGEKWLKYESIQTELTKQHGRKNIGLVIGITGACILVPGVIFALFPSKAEQSQYGYAYGLGEEAVSGRTTGIILAVVGAPMTYFGYKWYTGAKKKIRTLEEEKRQLLLSAVVIKKGVGIQISLTW